MEDVETKYHVIRLWWLSFSVSKRKVCWVFLSDWNSSIFRYRQWGGRMPLVNTTLNHYSHNCFS
jgi:hypothetical protein